MKQLCFKEVFWIAGALLALLFTCVHGITQADVTFIQAGQSSCGDFFYTELIVHGGDTNAIFIDSNNLTSVACGNYGAGKFCVFGHGT